MYKGQPVTAGSKMLENFISPITAAAVAKLENAGIVVVGKAKMDEFGVSGLFPSASEEQKSGISGAVAVVAEGEADFALCNDYTGAISIEAAENGLYYIHPTYGSVSRYGLIPTVASMDQIGIVCRSPEKGQHVLSIISGFDASDGVMPKSDPQTAKNSRETAERDHENTDEIHKNPKVGVPIGTTGLNADFNGQNLSSPYEIIEIELKYSAIYKQVMQILCSAELSAAISRYDGIKFGYRAKEYSNLEELYKKSRSETFGSDVKLAAIMGAMVLSEGNYLKYYDKAMRIRRLIRDSLDFQKYDVIISHPHLARLCGLPAVTIPHDGGALTLIANAGCEEILFSMLRKS